VLADYAPRREVETTLQPLLAADNPFRFSAQEIMAYTMLRTGARNDALAAWDRLAKESAAPAGVRKRATEFAEYLRANPDITVLPTAVMPPVLPAAPRAAPGAAPAPASAPEIVPTPQPSATPSPAPPPAQAPAQETPAP
jgi:hypothetical protein